MEEHIQHQMGIQQEILSMALVGDQLFIWINSESIHGTSFGSQRNMENSIHQKEMSEAHGSRGQNETGVTPISAEKVIAAAKAGLAAKAKLFVDHEEREIQRLSANIINHQLKRLELKLKQFAEVETLMTKECEQVDRQRQRVITEQACLISIWLGPNESLHH